MRSRTTRRQGDEKTRRRGASIARRFALLLLAIVMASGCADPLVKAKQTFSAGIARGRFDATSLETLEERTDDVLDKPDRYGAEGRAQAVLMLAYANTLAGNDARAAALLAQAGSFDGELSATTRALGEVVNAELAWEDALSLAREDIVANRQAFEDAVRKTADIYRAAQSALRASDPQLGEFFALRQADVLIGAGNVLRLLDAPAALKLYQEAAQTARDGIADPDDALAPLLLERAGEAERLSAEIAAPVATSSLDGGMR